MSGPGWAIPMRTSGSKRKRCSSSGWPPGGLGGAGGRAAGRPPGAAARQPRRRRRSGGVGRGERGRPGPPAVAELEGEVLALTKTVGDLRAGSTAVRSGRTGELGEMREIWQRARAARLTKTQAELVQRQSELDEARRAERALPPLSEGAARSASSGGCSTTSRGSCVGWWSATSGRPGSGWSATLRRRSRPIPAVRRASGWVPPAGSRRCWPRSMGCGPAPAPAPVAGG